jgi:hypothetical protein
LVLPIAVAYSIDVLVFRITVVTAHSDEPQLASTAISEHAGVKAERESPILWCPFILRRVSPELFVLPQYKILF